MKGPAKAIVLAVAVLVLVGGAFWGGMALQSAKAPSGRGGAFVVGDGTVAGRGVMGGPMADLTDEERAAFETMTEEERQAFLEENVGADVAGQPGGGASGRRGGALEGEVVEVASDTITLALASGGSQTVYTNADTVVAYVKGAGELAAGSTVMIMATPEADGVTTATLVVVTR